MNDMIEHEGIVIRLDDNRAIVKIVQQTACISCQVKGHCAASESKEKEVEALLPTNILTIGQQVTLCGERKLGLKAVLLAFVIPMIAIVLVLFAGTTFNLNEGVSALLSMAILAAYYGILYTLREKMKSKFQFKIKEQ